MRFGSYECWLAFEDRPLDEYSTRIQEGADELGPALLIAYTMSELGKPFHLNWRDHTARDTLLVTVRMDGKLVSRGVHAPGTSGRLRGIMTGPRSMRLFTFSSLDASRRLHASASNSGSLYADIGTIQVTMVPIRSIKSGPALGPGPVACDLPAIPSMHYISLRNECIPFDHISTENSAQTLSLIPGSDIDLMVQQTVVFEFRYRPLVHLQAMGIFPRSPSFIGNFPSISGSPPPDSISSMEDPSSYNCTLGKRSRQDYEDSAEGDCE